MKRRGFIKAILGSIALGTFELDLFEGAADALADLAPGQHDSFYAFGAAYVQMATQRPGQGGKIIGVTTTPEGEQVREERSVEYTDPKTAVGELGLDSMVQTVTESDGTKKHRTLFTDHRVLLKDGGGTCMWFGSPDEARKYAKRRGDITDPREYERSKGGLWMRTGPQSTWGP